MVGQGCGTGTLTYLVNVSGGEGGEGVAKRRVLRQSEVDEVGGEARCVVVVIQQQDPHPR